jgi:hypothetical protein
MQIEGGNKYKVRNVCPTEGNEHRGCYQLECVDFWCTEDLGDGIECSGMGQKLWIASFHVDAMLVETSSYFENL